MKLLFLLGLLVMSGYLLMNFGTVYAVSESSPLNPSDISKNCHPACFEFVPTHALQDNGGHQILDLSQNQNFIVIMADGSCNISGTFNQATNTCSAPNIILTPSDFRIWQTNVASMFVGNIYSTTLPENVGYCTLAAWSWQHQTPEFQTKYDIHDVIPSSCFTSTPDFSSSIALAVMIMGTVFAIGLSRKHG